MRTSLAFVTLAVLTLPLSAADTVTYTRDVAPILWKNCASCHRPGEIGPFPLLTYKDAAKRADFLADITSSRRMPPWKAEEGYGKFHDERRLTEAEIQTLAAWAKADAPEGDPKDLPPAPKFTEGWQLGTPDLVLAMPEPFTVPAGGRDILQCFVIPIPIDTDKTVAAVEFRPGNRRVVHHSILFLDSTGAGRKRDEAEAGPGYRSFGGPGILPTGGLGAWVPGATVRPLPDGVGKYLRKGSDLVLQIHYHPSGKEEKDQSTIGLYFTKKPAEKIVGGVALRSRLLYIPAGEKRHKVTAESDPLPVDVQALSVSPHMHLVGKEIKAYAETRDGQTIPLIWIKDWDFNWQGAYYFESPLKLPKGAVIKLEAYYDNSTDNPRNPNNPPKAVRWGEQTTDEMCLFGVQVITETRAELREVMQMRNSRLAALLGGGPPSEVLGDGGKSGGGMAIPQRLRERLEKYDKDGDGKLSDEEKKAVPALLRRLLDLLPGR